MAYLSDFEEYCNKLAKEKRKKCPGKMVTPSKKRKVWPKGGPVPYLIVPITKEESKRRRAARLERGEI